jgi:hypothetical protein
VRLFEQLLLLWIDKWTQYITVTIKNLSPDLEEFDKTLVDEHVQVMPLSNGSGYTNFRLDPRSMPYICEMLENLLLV